MPTDFWSKVIWVIIGLIVVNPIWEYLIKPNIEKLRSKYSQSVRRENAELQQRINAEVERLLADPNEREYFHFESLETRLKYHYQRVMLMFFLLFFIAIFSMMAATTPPNEKTFGYQITAGASVVVSSVPLAVLYWRSLRIEHVVDFNNKVNKLVRQKLDEKAAEAADEARTKAITTELIKEFRGGNGQEHLS